jgi:membrane-associated phospholipid phosphatase
VSPGRRGHRGSYPEIDGLRQVAVLAGGSVAFVLLARNATSGTVSASEERVFRAVNTLSPAIRLPAWFVMQSGSLPAVFVVAAAAFPRRRDTAVALAVGGTSAWALCKIVKRVVGRGRPADHLDNVLVYGAAQRGRGFPSGHAAVATALAAIVSRVVPRPMAQLVWVIAAVVGGTRLYVGAHLPLDVAGGAVLGLSVGGVANLALAARSQ